GRQHPGQQLQASWESRKGGGGNEPRIRTRWLTFHDRKWFTSKRPLTTWKFDDPFFSVECFTKTYYSTRKPL
ncbi:MAG: hypothetical protein Q7J27_09650, partial [Syntrophales bacterium]|nr:hypothetical protein [Syntrophales bacterium]